MGLMKNKFKCLDLLTTRTLIQNYEQRKQLSIAFAAIPTVTMAIINTPFITINHHRRRRHIALIVIAIFTTAMNV